MARSFWLQGGRPWSWKTDRVPGLEEPSIPEALPQLQAPLVQLHQQLRTQVSQSEVETEAIESAAASTANNYAEAKRLSRFLTRPIFSYIDEEQGIEQWGKVSI